MPFRIFEADMHLIFSFQSFVDRKLGVKARLSQSLPVTLNLVKNYATCPKHLQPILHVLKLYASNGELSIYNNILFTDTYLHRNFFILYKIIIEF